MYFEDYKKYPEAQVNPSLLWEYDLSSFDFKQMRKTVVQRVVERGWPQDWYAILNLYGQEGVKDAIKQLPYLSAKDMNFVTHIFQIPLSQLKCYERKQSHPGHWNS